VLKEKSALNILGVPLLVDAWSTDQGETETEIVNKNLTENSSGREAISGRHEIREKIGAVAEIDRCES
jgi:hypothetical protein